MHGLIVAELQRFIGTRAGEDAWDQLTEGQARPLRDGDATAVHDDAAVIAVVTRAADALDTPISAVLEDFGRFLVPALLDIYRPLVTSEWGALDLIEQTEAVMHTAVRLQLSGAEPPTLQVRRLSDAELVIDYTSPRRLCGMAVGIVRGVADEYDVTLDVKQATCMLRGDDVCAIHVSQRQ